MADSGSPQIGAAPRRYAILIPAYEPDATLPQLVNQLVELLDADIAFAGVIIVNDGSRKDAARAAFEALCNLSRITIVEHETNRGKGGALKTGFRHILENNPEVSFVVTADADGQHSPGDIMKVARQALVSGAANIGYRTFSHDVPFRSRIGNLMTAAIFRIATGREVFDTQSGLRTYLRADLPRLCAIKADRYDYEFHCLFDMARNSAYGLDQVPIETIYEPGNPTSHFNPFMDSLRIYAVFFRYISVSAFSGAIDFLIFSILTLFSAPTLTALIAARAVSAPIYFIGMRNVVFKSHGAIPVQALGTALLMLFHIAFLWRFISWLESHHQVHPIGAMLAGLLLFYIGNFLVQRFVIYPFRTST